MATQSRPSGRLIVSTVSDSVGSVIHDRPALSILLGCNAVMTALMMALTSDDALACPSVRRRRRRRRQAVMSEAENGEWTCRVFSNSADKAEKATTNVTLLGESSCFFFVRSLGFAGIAVERGRGEGRGLSRTWEKMALVAPSSGAPTDANLSCHRCPVYGG